VEDEEEGGGGEAGNRIFQRKYVHMNRPFIASVK
jgi:hypothetical protein